MLLTLLVNCIASDSGDFNKDVVGLYDFPSNTFGLSITFFVSVAVSHAYATISPTLSKQEKPSIN